MNVCNLTTSRGGGGGGGRAQSAYPGYRNLIAPFLTDFNPSAHPDAKITSAAAGSRFVARWANLALDGSNWRGFTFSVELKASGHVKLHLGSVSAPEEDVPDDVAPTWLVHRGGEALVGEALVVALRLFGPQLERTFITSEQKVRPT